MVIKPDAGDLVAQRAVPILVNDTASDVFRKLVCAAEQLILRSVPTLIDGSARETPQDLSQGSYFGGRRPEDGRIDWRRPAREIHNLIRAVAPPYPGAFFDAGKRRILVLGSYYRGLRARSPVPRLYWQNGMAWADCSDGRRLLLTALHLDNSALNEERFAQLFGNTLPLGAQTGPNA
jgi:methionyl-tRNA formyltransferase